jgi:Ca-activated chloride channel family protein
MSFAWPHFLWLLALPAGLLLWEVKHRRLAAANAHPKILRAEVGATAVQLTSPAGPASRDATARARFWLCAGLALVLIALARPQWGQLEEPVFDQSREILLAVDLSRSMLTPDVKPSRLERTKLLIQSLLEKLEGERVGLVVFSGTSFLQVPLSADYEILREFLPNLGPAFLPEGGSNYGAMLEASVQAFGATGAADRFLIVLSDGEATDTAWKERLEDLKKKSIRVLGLGVGTAGGGMIPEGDGGFVKDERGAVVLSKLEPATLQELARATGGVYRDASTWIDLAALVAETIAAGRTGEFVEKNTVRLVERFQWPLAFGLWCLLVSFYYEFPVRPKPRVISLRSPEKAGGSKETLTRAATLLLLLLSPFTLLPAPALAAAKLAQPPAAKAGAPAAAAPGEPSVLAKIISRLSAAENRSARDWAELSRETVTWGSRLQSQQQPVPEGPVRDALAAVDLGEKLDAQTTDWKKLREELEALLQKKDQDEPDQDQKKENKNDQKDKNQKQDPSKQDQQDQEQNQDQQQDQSQGQPGDDKSQKKDPSEKDSQDNKPDGDSAFGDMTKKEDKPPPPPPENTQQVGGSPEKKDEEAREQLDPSLALPMQKLEQLRNQDSPAQLFQLLEGERKSDKKSGPKSGKNW